MDDNTFDNFLKGKVGEYEDPHFDEVALARFQQQRGIATSIPWYRRYRTELIVVSALIVFTLINGWWLLSQEDQRYEALLQQIDSLQTDNRRIYDLQQQLSVLKRELSDTTRYLVAEKEQKDASLSKGMAGATTVRETERNGRDVFNNTKTSKTVLAPQPSQSGGQPVRAYRRGLAARPPVAISWGSTPLGILPLKFPVHTTLVADQEDDTQDIIRKRDKPALSAQVTRELEKHFHRGVGINVGPTGSVSGSFYEVGDSELNVGEGHS